MIWISLLQTWRSCSLFTYILFRAQRTPWWVRTRNTMAKPPGKRWEGERQAKKIGFEFLCTNKANSKTSRPHTPPPPPHIAPHHHSHSIEKEQRSLTVAYITVQTAGNRHYTNHFTKQKPVILSWTWYSVTGWSISLKIANRCITNHKKTLKWTWPWYVFTTVIIIQSSVTHMNRCALSKSLPAKNLTSSLQQGQDTINKKRQQLNLGFVSWCFAVVLVSPNANVLLESC